jgi:hypothetical protein
MLRARGARLCETASRFAQHGHLKTRMPRYALAKGKAKGIATRMVDDDRPRSGLRDWASPEWAKTRQRGYVAIGDSTGRPVHGRAPLPYPAC